MAVEIIMNMPTDGSGNSMMALPLLAPVDLDGSAPAEAHTGVLTGGTKGTGIARIVAVTGAIRFLVGVDAEADGADHPLAEGAEIWYPFSTGERVSIYGGIASVAVAGKSVTA